MKFWRTFSTKVTLSNLFSSKSVWVTIQYILTYIGTSLEIIVWTMLQEQDFEGNWLEITDNCLLYIVVDALMLTWTLRVLTVMTWEKHQCVSRATFLFFSNNVIYTRDNAKMA